ncbi:hypothetical protein [Marinobacter sp. NFXS9]|uniref:hypothetical protein n=1 Tax=Marinobacter sp. NFXS9 TaxID=2818433 RepID=UPI0032E028E1
MNRLKFLSTWFTALLIIFGPSSSRAAEEQKDKPICKTPKPDELFSSYVTFDAMQYGGGLTSDELAKNYVGKAVRVERNLLQIRDITIHDPNYEISCYSLPEEGEVGTNHWSNFYGFGLNRKLIKVLHVYDPKK